MKNKIITSIFDKVVKENMDLNSKNGVGERIGVSRIDTEVVMEKFLEKGDVKYCQRIQCLDILAEQGYNRPQLLNYAKEAYDKKACELANLLSTRLKDLNFKADKQYRVKRFISNPKTPHVPTTTVYTNMPGDVYFKANRAMSHGEASMKAEHDHGIEMFKLEQASPESYRLGEEFRTTKVANGYVLADLNIPVKEKFNNFREFYETERERLFNHFKTDSTEAYKEKYGK